jgi:hypothetical protein
MRARSSWTDWSKVSERPVSAVYIPLQTKQTQLLGGGDAKAGAVELVEKLKSEVRVI